MISEKKKALKSKKASKILKKPSNKKVITELDAVRTLMKGEHNTKFVAKGKIGFFNFDEEYQKEKIKWLGD